MVSVEMYGSVYNWMEIHCEPLVIKECESQK